MSYKYIKILLNALFISLLLLSAQPLFSQYYIEKKTDVSWETGDILLYATATIPDSAANLASTRFQISESIDRGLASIELEAFEGIFLDSLHNLSEAFTANREKLVEFDALALTKSRVSSSMSLDLSSVTNTYKFNIFEDLIPILIDHKKPEPVPDILNWEPTASFSGIVIYAAEPLPYYGESETGILQPAVFPKIFSTGMELAASASMADPEYLKKWGFVLYTDSIDERKFEERIGLYPLRTVAESIFGNNHTDILIPAEAVRKLLYNKDNRRLIREGRIMIIIGSPENINSIDE